MKNTVFVNCELIYLMVCCFSCVTSFSFLASTHNIGAADMSDKDDRKWIVFLLLLSIFDKNNRFKFNRPTGV